jgi:hypothetical protein
MNDMSLVIIPKSDQISADDLIAGPKTITITEVDIRPGTEQPVSIRFEGDDGRPWKPCTSMSRVLVSAWGPDAKNYVGRSVTLYRDPKVKWGGMEVGGIRVSNMSHIERDLVISLTATKGKRAPYMVKPLQVQKPKPVENVQPQPAAEPKRRTWADVLPEIQLELNDCTSIDAVKDIAGRPMIQSALSKPESATAQRLNAMIKEALDRFSEPVTDDDAPHWSDEIPDDAAAA